jgi:tetratricopeptide (TPR) repeat protein
MTDDRWPRAGQRIAERYVVEGLAARGGMGSVYRAHDEATNEVVAMKLVPGDGESASRLLQEARVLASLHHPAIVRYVDHGPWGPHGTFLAMEWIDGEDLSDRLQVGLGVPESLAIVGRVADGLAIAHAYGLVHRDIKPSNIRLGKGAPDHAILIDFGVACSQSQHPASLAPRVTAAGIVLGTVGYMSPEQATGDPDLDPRSDVFALGCVLYECLTGQPAFAGDHVMAVLAKVLRERPPRARDARPELPPALDELVAKMLAKDRSVRPADAAAVAEELRRIPYFEGGVPEVTTRQSSGLSGSEQRPMSVMLALVPGGAEPQVEALVERYGGVLSRLANGGLLVTLTGHGDAGGQVVTDSACALSLRRLLPSARIGLATGWAPAGNGPPGSLIDRAASLLAGSVSPGIRIDDVTAGLLGTRFETRRDGEATALVGPRADIDVPRTLLGKSMPCLGRDREMDLLLATLRESETESVARAVVVTGPAGQGKSRLAHELRIRAGDDRADLLVLRARGDPLAPGSSLALARQLVRQAALSREGAPAATQRSELAAHVAGLCDPDGVLWVVDFLAELLGLPPAEATPSERYRAARNDARMMSDGLRRAFAAWIADLCRRGPLLVVLDDLQWGDEPSVLYLSDALRALRARPLTVLALGRPELRTRFPRLFESADRVDVALPRLGRRAAERIVRIALGAPVDASIAEIVDRADGNALYLEELIRHFAVGAENGPLPDTVLALTHSRIERLDPDARRVLRAASIFGKVCWPRGLAALLGVSSDDRDLSGWIDTLVQAEVLEPAAESRLKNEVALAFRADLLREAAYASLTESDRAKGHLLAGTWLESVGESDALRIAEHFDRSADRSRALAWWPRAATTALKAGGFEAAVELCSRARALDPRGAARGRLLHTEGVALAMRGDLRGCAERLREAMLFLESGSSRWFACVATLLLTGTFLGDGAITLPLVGAVLDPAVEPEPSGPYGVAVYAASLGLAMVGHLDAAEAFLARAEQLTPDAKIADPTFVVAVELTRAALCLARGDVGSSIRELASARAITERTGDESGELLVALHESAAYAEAGDEARCRKASERLGVLGRKLGAASFADWGKLSVAQVLLAQGGGRDLVEELSELVTRLDPMFVAFARGMLSQAFFAAGDLDSAEHAARTTCDDASMFPGAQATALGTLARVALRRGDPSTALELVQRGLAAAARVGSPRDVSVLMLARVDALAACRSEEHGRALADARARIERIAGSFDDSALRDAYVTRVEVNARTMSGAPGV